jgi:hypothetical protein
MCNLGSGGWSLRCGCRWPKELKLDVVSIEGPGVYCHGHCYQSCPSQLF